MAEGGEQPLEARPVLVGQVAPPGPGDQAARGLDQHGGVPRDEQRRQQCRVAVEVTSGAGIAVTGTILAALFTGDIATTGWTAHQTAEFREAVTVAGLTLTAVAAALVVWGFGRARRATPAAPAPEPVPA
ncbi:hypothetical protein ABT369_29510 [Dactylosporangium sp. NPDC000244]|uniref:hypothetical protein n=1 Tax=Dactylosporangium sp. NPDC000244 TaxID=3154365 RepID=UPI00332F645C